MSANTTISSVQASLLAEQMREFIALPDADKVKVLAKLLAGLAEVLTVPVYQQVFALGMMMGAADTLTGEKLSAMRKAMGVKQKELADLLGINPVNITNWESGKEAIPKRRIPQLLAALNYSSDRIADQLAA